MSRLDELIAELCPDGVQYVPVGEMCSIQTGSQLNKEILKKEGKYPVYNGGINPSGYHDEFNTGPNTIAISQGGANAGFVNWVEVPFFAGAHCYTIKNVSKQILNRYLYFCLKNEQDQIQNSKHGAGIPGLNSKVIKNLRIPLPPLPVQQEIVRILDNFTKLIDKLRTEQTARKKQYEYYRDKLLSFRGILPKTEIGRLIAELCPDGVKHKFLSEVCDISRGRVISKEYLRDNSGEYPVYSSQTENNGIFGFIDNYDYDCESITWTTDGANAGSVFYHFNEKFSITNVCGLIRVTNHNVMNTKFLYYYLQITAKNYVNSGMGNPKLMSNVMARVKVPLPPLPVQQEIVRILDNFTELIDKLKAEQEARQKQYEYYRNKLLSFKEAKS